MFRWKYLFLVLLFQHVAASVATLQDGGIQNAVTRDLPGIYVDSESAPAMVRRAQTLDLPRPFDSSLSSNYTSTCEAFFTKILANQDFINCVPLSLLLYTSSSFYQATKSFFLITQTLDASCAADFTSCQALMDSYADELLTTACPVDYNNRNQNVLEAYNGFVAYPSLYYTGCLRSGQAGQTGSYCFANAVTNQSDPTASYIYYLPLGTPLPAGTLPGCNGCLKTTFSIYNVYAGNSSLPLYRTYPQATQEIDVTCGPNFVKTTVDAIAPNSGMRVIPLPGLDRLLIAATLAISLLL